MVPCDASHHVGAAAPRPPRGGRPPRTGPGRAMGTLGVPAGLRPSTSRPDSRRRCPPL